MTSAIADAAATRTASEEQAVRVAVVGAAGRMGQRLVALGEAQAGLEIVGRYDLDAPVSAAGLRDARCDVLIDFTLPAALPASLEACRGSGAGLVLGTTGLDAAALEAVEQATADIAVLHASNFSIVVNVLHHLTRQAVRILGDGWDREVLEAHHRYKADAPSGTALALARTVADAAGLDPERSICTTRSGADALRRPDDITVQTLRIGDHAGEHTVFLAAPGERLELKHVSTSRDSYASGALRAAAWLGARGRPAGRYDIKEVLGLA